MLIPLREHRSSQSTIRRTLTTDSGRKSLTNMNPQSSVSVWAIDLSEGREKWRSNLNRPSWFRRVCLTALILSPCPPIISMFFLISRSRTMRSSPPPQRMIRRTLMHQLRIGMWNILSYGRRSRITVYLACWSVYWIEYEVLFRRIYRVWANFPFLSLVVMPLLQSSTSTPSSPLTRRMTVMILKDPLQRRSPLLFHTTLLLSSLAIFRRKRKEDELYSYQRLLFPPLPSPSNPLFLRCWCPWSPVSLSTRSPMDRASILLLFLKTLLRSPLFRTIIGPSWITWFGTKYDTLLGVHHRRTLFKTTSSTLVFSLVLPSFH